MSESDEAKVQEVKTTVMKGLEVARWKLLEKHPFIGEMLLRFSIIPTYDCRCNTAATDGSKIFFDCEFYSTLDEAQREFVLAHEVWHNIFLHFTRMQARDPMMWNIATDMEINHMLQNEGMSVLKDACLPDPIVAGKNAEDIYAYLQKQAQKQQKQKQNGKGNGNGDGNGNGEGDEGEDDDGDSHGNGSSGNGKQKQKGKGGGKNGNKSKHGNQFDRHIYEGDSAGDGEKQNGKWGEKGFDKDFNPSMKDAKETEDKIKEMVTSVAQSIERKQGHLPAGIDQLVKEMLKPEINWKEALSQFVTKCLNGDHSWRRCSRHALGRGMYLPGKDGEKIKCAVAVDTSGSYLADLPKFLGELNSIVKTFGSYEITLIQCDAEVQEVKKYTDDEPMDVENFKAKGGGGTDFRPVFKWLRENNSEDINCLVFFTDGYGTSPTYPPPYPTLWVLTADGTEDFCEWGEKMRYKPEHYNGN